MPTPRLPALAAAACACALALFGSVALAGDPAAAEALFDEGHALMEAEDYEGACAKFQASMDAEPSGGAALNLGRCSTQLGKTASAWAAYRRAEGLFRQKGEQRRQQFAHDKAAQLESKLSRLTIEVDLVDGLSVTRNGEPVASGVLNSAVPVDPGTHRIEAEATGRQSWSGTVTVGDAGASETIRIPALDPLPEDAAGDEARGSRGEGADAPSGEGGSDPLLVAGVVLAGVGGAAVIGGSILGGIVLGEASDAKELCPANQCPPEGIDAKESAESKALGADLLIGLGSVVAATGIVLVVISALSDTDTEPESSAALLPLLGPTEAGLAATLAF
ncbi:MAG: hypothetical protein JRI23_09960 [Deltaproteobacteria bacterium]|jgi:hypothetical protein|nr:hypothetical protein [Deltaproteobacteria bacterium]MBW2531996.1 hypothetical protein [Deltaproteobacteria bacterium]